MRAQQTTATPATSSGSSGDGGACIVDEAPARTPLCGKEQQGKAERRAESGRYPKHLMGAKRASLTSARHRPPVYGSGVARGPV
jgi:hypothetical protein